MSLDIDCMNNQMADIYNREEKQNETWGNKRTCKSRSKEVEVTAKLHVLQKGMQLPNTGMKKIAYK